MAMCMNDVNKKDGLVRGLILFIFRNGWNVLKKKMLNRQVDSYHRRHQDRQV